LKEFWNQRYSEDGYAYGTAPNVYFREALDGLATGRLYLPGEGEGRNAVYAALNGWTVDAIDYSDAGKDKALALAMRAGVQINFSVADLADHIPAPGHFDAAALIFLHFPESLRTLIHRRTIEALKPGGVLILEAFSKKQLAHGTGGPKSTDLLYELDELRADFAGMEIMEERNMVTDVREGPYHDGTSDVLRMLLRKP
jgi:SAM-dependent methyltransferase